MGAVEVLAFERSIIRTLCEAELGSTLLDSVFRFPSTIALEHSGVGYFLTLSHPNLPVERNVFHMPHILGRLGDYSVGYLVFVQDKKLMLECYSSEDSLPEDVRSNAFVAESTDNVLYVDAT